MSTSAVETAHTPRLAVRFAAVWALWAACRAGLVWLYLKDTEVRGDVFYYWAGIYGDNPADMTEYPHAGVWPTHVVSWISGPEVLHFVYLFMGLCILVDAAFLLLLLRGARKRPAALLAGAWWALFGLAAGPVFMTRLDLFPALAVAACATLVVSHPRIAAAFLALATTMKLWPGVLAAGLVGRWNQRDTYARVLWFVFSVAALCAVTVVTSGWERLRSPLTYQTDRGLQIESIPATWTMWTAFHSPENFDLGYASSKSFEVAGPGVDAALTLSSIAMVCVVLGALGWAVYSFVRGGWHAGPTMAFFVLVVLGLICANKVFSPQYIVWLGPLLAVALRQTAITQAAGAAKWILALLTLVAAGLGTFIYPFHYDSLWATIGEEFAPIAALCIRNALMVLMALVAAAWLVVESRQARRISA